MTRPRVLLVHGSVVNGEICWSAQRPLAERFELVVPDRPGFPPGPPLEQVCFADELAFIEPYVEPGTHVVGHSYGGVVCLLAAMRRTVASLTVVEPPAFAVGAGNPIVDDYVAGAKELWETGPTDPEVFLREFLRWVGAPAPTGAFTTGMLQGAQRLRIEQPPWEADIDLAAISTSVLAISGGHHAAFEAICDTIAEGTGAERIVLRGAGHSVQRLGEPFNAVVAEFVERQEALRSGSSSVRRR